jgi:hypothetical protein
MIDQTLWTKSKNDSIKDTKDTDKGTIKTFIY